MREREREMGSSHSSPKKHVFVWRIGGFTSLLEQGEGSSTASFKMHGVTWSFYVNPMDMDRKSAGDAEQSCEKHVSLLLHPNPSYMSRHPDRMLQTKLQFFIRDQRYGEHAQRKVRHTYMMSCERAEAACMVPLETLKNRSAGFLVNDTVVVGVEFVQFEKVLCHRVEAASFIQKEMNKLSSGSYTWCIEDFFQLNRPTAFSEPFQIAGYTWKLRLHPEGQCNKDYVSLYLALDEKYKSHYRPSSGVMVEVVLSIKASQSKAYKLTSRCNLAWSRSTCCGYPEFISQEHLKEYLIKGRSCTIEASITVLGSASHHASSQS